MKEAGVPWAGAWGTYRELEGLLERQLEAVVGPKDQGVLAFLGISQGLKDGVKSPTSEVTADGQTLPQLTRWCLHQRQRLGLSDPQPGFQGAFSWLQTFIEQLKCTTFCG